MRQLLVRCLTAVTLAALVSTVSIEADRLDDKDVKSLIERIDHAIGSRISSTAR